MEFPMPFRKEYRRKGEKQGNGKITSHTTEEPISLNRDSIVDH